LTPTTPTSVLDLHKNTKKITKMVSLEEIKMEMSTGEVPISLTRIEYQLT